MTPARPTQSDKALAFRALHERPGGFVMPNPWDIGTARLLEQLGFLALASTSAGFAFSRGRRDNGVPLEALLTHLGELAGATNLPLSADLENGFGDTPDEVARTIVAAARTGIVGGSIEDATGRPDDPVYSRAASRDRVRAAVEAARSLPFAFTLTARAENHAVGRPDLADTIARLQDYQEAGADVLFAPGLTSEDDIRTVLREVDRPLNVMIGSPSMALDVGQLAALGVQRVSSGAALARAAFGAFLRAATELQAHGTTAWAHAAVSGRELEARFPVASRHD